MSTTISGTNGVSQCDTDSVSTNDIQNAAITAAKLSGAQTGSAPVFGCRAWCVFNGTTTGTNAPIAGGNVTSVTRTATGQYTINFTTALPDANYAVTGSCQDQAGGASALETASQTTTSASVISRNSGTGFVDNPYISIAIFR